MTLEEAQAEDSELRRQLNSALAILRRLPLTRDGVPIAPEMEVWLVDRNSRLSETVKTVSRGVVELHGRRYAVLPRRLCSSSAGALAAWIIDHPEGGAKK